MLGGIEFEETLRRRWFVLVESYNFRILESTVETEFDVDNYAFDKF